MDHPKPSAPQQRAPPGNGDPGHRIRFRRIGGRILNLDVDVAYTKNDSWYRRHMDRVTIVHTLYRNK